MILGLIAGVWGAQIGGLRLGGVVVVPLMTVYLLRSFSVFPVFVMAIVAAYVSLYIVKRRLLLYGRSLFIISVLVGAAVPFLVFEILVVAVGLDGGLSQFESIGSVLPGVAAYNFHRIDDEKRVLDMVWSLTVVLFLTVVAIGVTIFVGLTPLATALPPVLLGPESDIANAFNLVVDTDPVRVIGNDLVVLGLIAIGTILSEFARSRYGLRVAGVVVIPLVVLAAFRNLWMLPLWAGTSLVAYAGIRFIHWWTLLYGRVLLALSFVFGLLVTISVVPVIPVEHGLLPFFIGLFGGITGYNLQLVPPAERRATVLVTISVFAALTLLSRPFMVPSPGGYFRSVTGWSVAAVVVAGLPGVWELYNLERIRPAGESLTDDSARTDRTGGPRDDLA